MQFTGYQTGPVVLVLHLALNSIRFYRVGVHCISDFKYALDTHSEARDFDKGDCVSICVPKADGTGKDLPRITCVIKEVYGHEVKSFVLFTEYVSLRERFRTGASGAYNGSVS